MKMKLLALVAVVAAGATFLFGSGAGTALANSPGPQDHTWTLTLGPTNASAVAGAATDYTVTLGLGALSPATSATPGATAFFGEATTVVNGFQYTQCSAKGNGVGAFTGTCGVGVGAKTGLTSFTIQSNVTGAPGNINPATGQPAQCGSLGTLTIPAHNFNVYTGVTDLASSTVPSTPSSLAAGYSKAAEPDPNHGGMPMAVSNVPDWFPTVMAALGIPQIAIQTRGYGNAPTPAGGTDVTFLVVDATPTGPHPHTNVSITILNDPIAAFDPASQTTQTCPPFSSNVTSYGNATGETWNCATSNPETGSQWATAFTVQLAGCSTSSVSAGGAWQKVDAASAGVNSWKIFLSSAPIDNGGTRFQEWDTCRLDANGPDSVGNGIGDNCRAGGSYLNNAVAVPTGPENANASALANALLACTSVDAGNHTAPGPQVAEVSPPWAACQDANQNGALNATDNCPLATDTVAWANLSAPGWPGTISSASYPIPAETDSDRDGVGDLCDPNPVIKGDGNGYASGFLVGTGSSGIATAGKYKDFNDICDDPYTVGTGVTGPAACLAADAGLNVIMTSQGQAPDFLNPGSGSCVQNFKDDSNHDGYNDGLQGLSSTAPVGCTPYPAKGLGQDPLKACPGRLFNDATYGMFGGTPAQDTAAKLARYDVQGKGKIVLADLVAIAGQFNQPVSGPTDFRALLDVQNKGKIVLSDLVAVAGQFNQLVPPC